MNLVHWKARSARNKIKSYFVDQRFIKLRAPGLSEMKITEMLHAQGNNKHRPPSTKEASYFEYPIFCRGYSVS